MIDTPPRYFLRDLMAGTEIAEVDLTTCEWRDTLDRQQGLSASIPAADEKALLENFEPGATALWIEAAGDLRFGGIVWNSRLGGDDATDVVDVSGLGFMSAYKDGRRLVRGRAGMTYATTQDGGSGEPASDVSWLNVDQFRIVADLFAHAANSGGAGDVGFDAVRFNGPGVGGLSGVARTRTVWAYEKRTIADVLEELARLDDGFDYAVNVAWNGSNPERYLDLYYPRRGRSRSSSSLVFTLGFEIGKGVTLESYEADALGMANRMTAIGPGSADARVFAEAQDASLVFPTGSYPLLEGQEAYTSDEQLVNLADRAAADLAASKRRLEIVTFRIYDTDDPDLGLGSFVPGDSCRLNGDVGFVNLDDWYRLVEVSPRYDSDGRLTIGCVAVTEAASLGAV